MQNEEVVRKLNKLIRTGQLPNQELASKLRDSTIKLQGTALAETGLPYLAAVTLVKNQHILDSLKRDF